MTYPRIRRTLLCALISCSAMTAPAVAQLVPGAPVRTTIDGNGVDLFDGSLIVKGPAMMLGQNGANITYQRWTKGYSRWSDNITAFMSQSGNTLSVSIGNISDSFTVSGTTYTSTEANGSTLSYNSTTQIFTYRRSDGMTATFNKKKLNDWIPYSNSGLIQDISLPSGEKISFSYDEISYCYSSKPGGAGDICIRIGKAYRLGNVSSNFGYTLAPSYDPNYEWFYDSGDVTSQPDFITWSTPLGMNGYNGTPTIGGVLVSQSFSDGQVTDSLARTTHYRWYDGKIAGITYPGSNTEDVTIAYSGIRVSSVAKAGGNTSYSHSDTSNIRTVTVTNAKSEVTTYTFDIASKRLKSVTDALSRTITYDYDAYGRLTKTTAPEGNYTQVTYDARGNVTESRAVAKTGSGLADIVSAATYPATCTNPVTCNSPNWTKDAKGNQTDYSYDSVHGGVATVTAPADANGVRPQIRNSYTLTNGVYKLTGQSSCRTTANCVGTADETKTTIAYNGNALPTSVTTAAGDGSLSATTTATYDAVGNVKTVDGPLAGTGDTITYRYDAGRQLTGVVTPDPDGSGTRLPMAQRITYNPDGQVSKTETGTVVSAADAHWTGFTPAQTLETSYDAKHRPIKQELKAAGTTHSVTQTGYDALGRVECSAQRMDPAQWASQTNACTPQTGGPNGPDRISKQVYDAAGQVTKVQTAVGTPDQADEVSATYTLNGQVETVTDGENNRTTYVYDGHDRLSRTRYPLPTQGANASSTIDYEQLSYDANSNVTQRRLRDEQLVNFGYDNLGRVITKDRPGSEADASYGYALTGALKTATESGQTITLGYDPLGRVTTQSDGTSTFTSAYDLAGNRTRLTYPDSFYVDYNRDVSGNVTAIRENGATSGVGVLAAYAYDNLGRPTSVTYGNGTSRSFGYDPASRLASLGVTLPAAPASNLSQSFTYNPASQIASVTRSNDAYAWNGLTNRNDSASINGLNQMTAQGALPLTHDTRGNITGVGASAYSYSSDNSLKTGPAGTSLAYDPLGRLQSVTQGSSVTRFGYDGSDLVTERNGSNTLTRRYVHGPGTDAPIVWYEGAGTTDRRFLHADERGSIVAVTNGAGAMVGTNHYDDYGVPAATNIGRFQYTGQTWVPELGLYYYKARFYDPKLGRFLQTDPIGYGDGMNMYAYVDGDPVNMLDPTGMKSSVYCTGSIIPRESCGGGNIGGSSLISYGGTWNCTNCGQEGQTAPDGSIVVTAQKWVWVPYQSIFWHLPATISNHPVDDEIGRLIKKGVCKYGNLDLGIGADGYAGLGGSVGGSVKLDLTRGQTGVDAYVAVGVGMGIAAGPTATFSEGGNNIVTANIITQIGGGSGVSIVHTRNIIGTNAGGTSTTVGKVGSPIAFANGGAAFGFHTPPLWDLGCDDD